MSGGSTLAHYAASGRDNNLNLLRAVAAMSVLLTHSFVLALGSPAAEPLRASIGMSLGDIAVDVFFVASGFLVTRSLLMRQDAVEFVCARLLRIIPALFVMLLLTVFCLGLSLTSLSVTDYLARPETWRYLLRDLTIVFGMAYVLPGVFEQNPYPVAVNGSLWTLPHEVRMYALLLVTWWLLRRIFKSGIERWFRPLVLMAAVGGGLALLLPASTERPAGHFLHLFYMFFAGAAACAFASSIVLTGRHALGASVALAFALPAAPSALFQGVYLLALPYLVLYLAFVPEGSVRRYNRVGDYSYGIYIFAFPIQQSLMALLPELSVVGLATASAALTLMLALPSWHLVERPALAFKTPLTAFGRSFGRRAT